MLTDSQITELSKKGYSHSDIAKLTGHSTVGVIATYDHTIASDIRDRAIRDIQNICKTCELKIIKYKKKFL
jgi:hypothetical protein